MLARHFFHTTGALHNRVGDTAGIQTRSPGSMSLARSHLSYGAGRNGTYMCVCVSGLSVEEVFPIMGFQ